MIVHDGGGSYRISGKNQHGIVFTKTNGCGVDFVLSVAEAMLNISILDPKAEHIQKIANEHVFQEVKRSSEMGLFTLTCNVHKGPEGKEQVVSRVLETSRRLYTTEMRLHGDAMSAAAMQAIVTSVPRMTRSNIPQISTSTAEDTRLKVRVPVKFVQVLIGYFIICTNNCVGEDNYERMRTLSKVCRCLPSCADAMDAVPMEDSFSTQSITYGQKRYVPSAQHTNVIQAPKSRGIFLSAMSVAHFTAFMQWTGMLGKLPSSMIVEEVLDCFYAQLDLSQSILNRNKYSADDRTRCFEVSKARVVATSLMVTSIQSVLSIGSSNNQGNGIKGKTLVDATELNASRLMFKALPVSMLPWLMADTLDHFFRLDFLILMQYFAKKLGAPSHTQVPFDAILEWLKRGDAAHCPPLQAWLDAKLPTCIKNAPLECDDTRQQLLSGLYLVHPHLCMALNPLDPGDIYKTASEKLGSFIYNDGEREFQQYCQIRSELGEGVLRFILSEVFHETMAWPSVFGTSQTLPQFWGGVPPPNRYHSERLMLKPIRLIRYNYLFHYVAKSITCVFSNHLFLLIFQQDLV